MSTLEQRLTDVLDKIEEAAFVVGGAVAGARAGLQSAADERQNRSDEDADAFVKAFLNDSDEADDEPVDEKDSPYDNVEFHNRNEAPFGSIFDLDSLVGTVSPIVTKAVKDYVTKR